MCPSCKFRSIQSMSLFLPITVMYVLVVLSTFVTASIVSIKSGRNSKYEYNYYYDDVTSPSFACDTVVLINVGTAMSVDNYKLLSESIVNGSSTIAIIIDSNPRNLPKDDGLKYATITNAIVQNISNIIPTCKHTNRPLYFIGGHSGGGKGAMNAIQENRLTFPVAGMIGLDPFQISKTDLSVLHIDLPSLYWGFSTTSCLVSINEAAKAAYFISNPTRRIFYQVQTKGNDLHCSFADSGCSFFSMCSGGKAFAWIHAQVGITFHRFVLAVKFNSFVKNQFVIDRLDVDLYVNNDTVSINTAQKVALVHAVA
jgi:hypothetical protein